MNSKDMAIGYAIGYNDAVGKSSVEGNFRAIDDNGEDSIWVNLDRADSSGGANCAYSYFDYSETITTTTTTTVGDTTTTTENTAVFTKRIITELINADTDTLLLKTSYNESTGEILGYTDRNDIPVYIGGSAVSSSMSGNADIGAIVWVLAKNTEQNDSFANQKKAYRQGLSRGEGVVEPWETDDTKIEFDTDEDGKSTSEVGYTDLNRGVMLGYANPNDPTDTRTVKVFLDHSLDNYSGWDVHGLLTIIVYDKDGNELSVARMPGTNSTHKYTWHSESYGGFKGYRINVNDGGGSVSGHYYYERGGNKTEYWTQYNTPIHSPSWNCNGYIYTGTANI